MNYQAIYDRLIERARGRALDGYSERHHIVPRCLGGPNVKKNLVRLTAEEHYIAHQLLVKIHPGHFGLLGAATMMASGSWTLQRNNKVYGWLRRRMSVHMTGRKPSPESIEKSAAKNRLVVRSADFRASVAAFHTGRKRSEETRAKMRLAQVKTPESKAKLSATKSGVPIHTAESRAIMSASRIGRVASPETRLKMSLAAKGKPKGPMSLATKAKLSAARTGKASAGRQTSLVQPPFDGTAQP